MNKRMLRKINPVTQLRKAMRSTDAASVKARRTAKAHQRFNDRATALLAGLDHTLPTQTRLKCDAYAQEVLGGAKFAPWLYVYSAVAGEFREGWIPENYYWQYYVERLSHKRLSGPRGLSRFFFENRSLPDIAYIVDGRLLLTDGSFVSQKAATDALFANNTKIIFKADHSRQGNGIRFFTPKTFDPDEMTKLGNGVFQRIITQHAAFDPISQHSLATLRFTTAHDEEGQFSLRGSFIHTGRSGDTFVAAKTALRIAFDTETGRISDTGYLPDFRAIDRHPDTQALFKDVEMPSFQASKDLALRLHKQMPYVQCIGWDIAVDHEGVPHLLEWNAGHTDIKFMEPTQGPCYADLGWAERWREEA